MKPILRKGEILSVLSKIAKRSAENDINQTCGFILYQPKVPESLLEKDKEDCKRR